MAKEYIPREDVINDIGELFTICRETYPNECGHHFIVEDELQIHLDHVRNLPPADVVEVVRCRECYFRDFDDADVPVCTGAMAYSYTPDDWFCAAGKCKDGEINNG